MAVPVEERLSVALSRSRGQDRILGEGRNGTFIAKLAVLFHGVGVVLPCHVLPSQKSKQVRRGTMARRSKQSYYVRYSSSRLVVVVVVVVDHLSLSLFTHVRNRPTCECQEFGPLAWSTTTVHVCTCTVLYKRTLQQD